MSISIKQFHENILRASSEVRSWPKWKQEIMGTLVWCYTDEEGDVVMTKTELDVVMRRLDEVCAKRLSLEEARETAIMAKSAIGRLTSLLDPLPTSQPSEPQDRRVFHLYQWIKEHTELHEKQQRQTAETLSAVRSLMTALRDLDPATTHKQAAQDLADARMLLDRLNKGFEAWQRETGMSEDWS